MGLAGSVGLGAATPRARAVCGHRAACFYADSRTHSSEQPGGAGAALSAPRRQERLMNLPREGHTAGQWLPVLGLQSRRLESARGHHS